MIFDAAIERARAAAEAAARRHVPPGPPSIYAPTGTPRPLTPVMCNVCRVEAESVSVGLERGFYVFRVRCHGDEFDAFVSAADLDRGKRIVAAQAFDCDPLDAFTLAAFGETP